MCVCVRVIHQDRNSSLFGKLQVFPSPENTQASFLSSNAPKRSSNVQITTSPSLDNRIQTSYHRAEVSGFFGSLPRSVYYDSYHPCDLWRTRMLAQPDTGSYGQGRCSLMCVGLRGNCLARQIFGPKEFSSLPQYPLREWKMAERKGCVWLTEGFHWVQKKASNKAQNQPI